MGLADCVVDITATGRTLIANHLVEVAEAGRSTARLISNQASLKTRSEAVNRLAAALRRTVAARAGAFPGAASSPPKLATPLPALPERGAGPR